jgi:succinylglutamate desuccinylase
MGKRCAEPTSEEQEQRELLAAIETALAQRKGPAVFLDLHTTSAEGQPFVVIGDSLPNRRFAFDLQAPVILGLEEQLEGTLLNYLSEQGHVVIGFEGGQHASPDAVQNHTAAIWSVLTTSGCLRPQDAPEKTPTEQVCPVVEIRYHHLIQAGDGFAMEPGFTNFQPVRRGQLLAHDRHGQIRAPESGQILMPLYQGQGADGFFLVRTVRRFWLRLAVWLRYLRLERLLPLLPGVRRHPDQAATLIVEPRIARWFVMEIFHLLGFRKKRHHAGKLLVSRRWHEPGVFEDRGLNQ